MEVISESERLYTINPHSDNTLDNTPTVIKEPRIKPQGVFDKSKTRTSY